MPLQTTGQELLLVVGAATAPPPPGQVVQLLKFLAKWFNEGEVQTNLNESSVIFLTPTPFLTLIVTRLHGLITHQGFTFIWGGN